MRNQSNPEHRKSFAAMRDMLEMMFPKAFVGEKAQRPALAIGIHDQLIQRVQGTYTPDQVHDFLSVWCRRPMYLISLARGGYRVDLDGVPVAEIDEESQKHAAYLLQASDRRKRARQAMNRKINGNPHRRPQRVPA